MSPKYQSLHYVDRGLAFQTPFDSWGEWLAQMRRDSEVVWAILVNVGEGRIRDEYHRPKPTAKASK